MAPLPLVSVVIPCFNHAHYLEASLGSVRAQNWPVVESIVVDDGSTDDTASAARALGASIVVRQTNQGLSRARNAGLAAARGKYVLFLDADDKLLRHAVRSGVAVLEQNPAAAVVGRRCRIMDAVGRPLPTTPPVLRTADLYAELLGMNFVWTPGAALFRRDAMQSLGGFPEHHPAAADYAVLLAFARQRRLLFDPREAVWYRKHESNMSRDSALMLRAVLAALAREQTQMPPQYRAACLNGHRRWREFYGEQLTMELRREWRVSRRAAKLIGGGLFLCRYCPRLAATHVCRKLARVVRRLPSTELEPPVSVYP
jgi:glycosyltransferase involved in cell wall biosynthesis